MMACPAAQAAHFRLGRQGLLQPCTSPEAVVDRLGREIGRSGPGEVRSVSVPPGDLTDAVVMHNHPEGGSFSHWDLYQSGKHALHECRSQDGPDVYPPTATRYRYRMQAGPDGWPPLSERQFQIVWSAAVKQVNHWIGQAASVEEAEDLYNNQVHYAMELLAERLRFRYAREPQ